MATSMPLPAPVSSPIQERSTGAGAGLRWKKSGRLALMVSRTADRLQRSAVLGGGGFGSVFATQGGQNGHSKYLSKLRRGICVTSVVATTHAHSVHVANLTKGAEHAAQATLLQGGIVTTVTEEELDTIPLWMQGDVSLATSEKIEQRQRLRFDRRVAEALQMWWEAALRSVVSIEEGGGDVEAETLTRDGHAMMLRRVYRVMLKELDEEDCERSIAEDWANDAKGSDGLKRRAFGDAFFECVTCSRCDL